MAMRLYDAHNHLQDPRLDAHRAALLAAPTAHRMVVAGSGEEDWPDVATLAQQNACVLPSFGVHPWYVREQSPDWRERLEALLAQFPQAGVGEIGLDRWISDADVALQQRFFTEQLALAARDNRPATLHCLRAWGLMEETLRATPRPERGFLLHSYGGPAEMVPSFVRLGAYFSVSPYFLHARKARQWATFAQVPLDRLLIETDAPDMWPPTEINSHPLRDGQGHEINHPANLGLMYPAVAQLRGMVGEDLAVVVQGNFQRLFGAA
jgi:TatD DNase family protein